MTRGKYGRSVAHRAATELAARVASLEEENDRLRSIENVALRHVEALAEIERLTRKVVELEREAGAARSAIEREATFRDTIADLQARLERRAGAILHAQEWITNRHIVGLHPLDAASELYGAFGVLLREATVVERERFEVQNRGYMGAVSAMKAGELRVSKRARLHLLRAIDESGPLGPIAETAASLLRVVAQADEEGAP